MSASPPQPAHRTTGVRLAEMSWVAAERVLTPQAVVVLPIGAASKEHGPHLPLSADWIQAEYLAGALMARCEVVVAHTLGYHHYPAFSEYPGSISLRESTARDLVIDICRSLASFGPRRFYALNTGISTFGPLAQSATELRSEGILLRFSDIGMIEAPLRRQLARQRVGTHADEVETSRLLYIAPQSVDMKLAVKDDRADGGTPLTRTPGGKGTYSPTGIWGDPTRATTEKGKRFVEALLDGIIAEIESLRAEKM